MLHVTVVTCPILSAPPAPRYLVRRLALRLHPALRLVQVAKDPGHAKCPCGDDLEDHRRRLERVRRDDDRAGVELDLGASLLDLVADGRKLLGCWKGGLGAQVEKGIQMFGQSGSRASDSKWSMTSGNVTNPLQRVRMMAFVLSMEYVIGIGRLSRDPTSVEIDVVSAGALSPADGFRLRRRLNARSGVAKRFARARLVFRGWRYDCDREDI
jgi:hypothetical protein